MDNKRDWLKKLPVSCFMMSYPAMPEMLFDHERCNESKNCVELRESGVDHGVGLDVVALADAYDTVGADLTLTDG